jgi:thiosulfate/3-mercaptopyruvate sulfurtransferase
MTLPPVLAPDQVPAGSLLLDTRPGAELFALEHLPGAQHADLDRFLSRALEPGLDPARGGRHPLPEPWTWAAQLGAWGVTPGHTVVAYDDANGGRGAARLWWMLRAAGHERAAVLDGGLQAGLASGLRGAAAAPAPPYPFTAWLRPTAALAEVDRRRRDPAWKVLDVRAGVRYRGESESLDPVAGHIPGALNLPFAENLDGQGRFKPAEELRRMYLELLAGTPPERLVVHCGSGVTACHTLLALERAGLPGAALYVGSWSEWCRNPLEREP